jgi:hypothetical protein
MFFMGGMTMGYLDPPVPAKSGEAAQVLPSPDKDYLQMAASDTTNMRDRAIERTLIWARRVLC